LGASSSGVNMQGTPVQNTLTELFALLHFLDPSEFPDPERSAQEFAQVDALSGAGSKGEGGVEQQISRLHELLTPRYNFPFPILGHGDV
jgi:chromodomain-helicase-DNA-binding protein 4